MEMFNGSDRLLTDTYMIPGTGLNPQLACTPPLEDFDYMGNETAPELIGDQGLYYPAAANCYGYYCTGFELPGELDDQQKILGLDGQDLQSGIHTEGAPYVYYIPSYEYAQSPYNPYNPYNPYIPGAVVGLDNQFIGTQQFLPSSLYQQPISSPTYIPFFVHSSSDVVPNGFSEPLTSTSGPSVTTDRPDSANIKYIPIPASSSAAVNNHKYPSGYPAPLASQSSAQQSQGVSKLSDGLFTNATHNKQPSSYGVIASSGICQHSQPQSAAHATVDTPNGRQPSVGNLLKGTVLGSSDFTNYGSKARGWDKPDKFRVGTQLNGAMDIGDRIPSMLNDQSRAPRTTSRSKSQGPSVILVKAYMTKAGFGDAQDNIVIRRDQYNRDDFPLDYPNTKFFVIKSYSEDDVHKSVKYNVWSSTPNGNKKLDAAYEEAQKLSAAKRITCPVFLLFSVNASGHFCGVAEMVGPVDFSKDMDFWQQDKWIGSFPVKWHMIKDVPNTSFRHIILENNENRPVTSSRDTQEVPYLPGLSMLHIFKNNPFRTSILDDFMFYEERQKIMIEERWRLNKRGYSSPFASSVTVPSYKPSSTNSLAPVASEKQVGLSNCSDSEPLETDGNQLHVTVDNLANDNGEHQNGTAVKPPQEAGKNQFLISNDGMQLNGAAKHLSEVDEGRPDCLTDSSVRTFENQVGHGASPKENCLADHSAKTEGNSIGHGDRSTAVSPKDNSLAAFGEQKNENSERTCANGLLSVIKIGTLAIDTKGAGASSSARRVSNKKSADIVTVGSMHIRVSDNGQSSLIEKA